MPKQPAPTNPSTSLPPPTGGKFIEWYGKSGRSYFLQVSDASDHLNKWKWATVIERGEDEWISYEVDSTADKAFFRLQYTEQTATNLDYADFDGDGLTNLQEITPVIRPGRLASRSIGGGSSTPNSTQTNPLDGDTDRDGTNDGDDTDPTDPNSGGTPPGSDAGGAGNGSGGTGGNPSGGSGGNGNTAPTNDDSKLVYRAAIYHRAKWYSQHQASVELHSASLLALFSGNVVSDTIGIRVDDNGTINAHPHSQSATDDYQTIVTYVEGVAVSPSANANYTGSDASGELHNLFTPLTVQPFDPLTTWKEVGKRTLPFGSNEQLTDQGRNPLWFTSRSTAWYQFAIRADNTTSSDVRTYTRDFLQVLTRHNEFTGLQTQGLAEVPLISKNFYIAPNKNFSDCQNITTPISEVSDEYGVAKILSLVSVRIADNTTPTGVDITSRDTAASDIGHQANYWIMAPAGNVPASSQKCNNAMQFKIPLPKGTRLKIICPGATPSPAIISPRSDNEPTVAWNGVANTSSDLTPVFKIGTEESAVDLPIRVKVMKNRKVRVKVHLVTQERKDPQTGISYPVEVDSSMVPTKAELENYLNPLFAYQINTWFDVTINPTPLVVDFSDDISVNPDNPTADQNLVTNAIPGELEDYHINVFIVGKLGTLNESYGSTSPSQATCWILGKPFNNYLTKQNLLETLGHEIGHVFFDLGHPNEESNWQGKAPLLGTDHSKRLMCKGVVFSSNSRLIVKSEWDAAEAWLKAAEIILPMNP